MTKHKPSKADEARARGRKQVQQRKKTVVDWDAAIERLKATLAERDGGCR